MTLIPADHLINKKHSYIKLYNKEDFINMHKVGELTAKALDMMVYKVKEGVTTNELNNYIFDFASKNHAYPAALNYRGYPKSICTSINHVVCHGIPNDKPLKTGDIINIDVALMLDGWYGDSSRMYTVGKISRKAERLIEHTYNSMMQGIQIIKPLATTGDIGAQIQNYAQEQGYSIVEDFCGHGIGKAFHDEPNILHYGKHNQGVPLKEGMCFTVEPMINVGKKDVKILSDGWTVVTRDKSLSAQFEHAIGVTQNGYEIFTLSPKGFNYPPYL